MFIVEQVLDGNICKYKANHLLTKFVSQTKKYTKPYKNLFVLFISVIKTSVCIIIFILTKYRSRSIVHKRMI